LSLSFDLIRHLIRILGRIDATNCTLRGVTQSITIGRGKTTTFTILAKDKFGNIVKPLQIQNDSDSEEDDSLYSGVLYDEKELSEKRKVKSATRKIARAEQQLFAVSIIEGPTKANITVDYNDDIGNKLQEDDYCLVKFKPLQIGHYVLKITYDNQELFESPLHVFVEHGKC